MLQLHRRATTPHGSSSTELCCRKDADDPTDCENIRAASAMRSAPICISILKPMGTAVRQASAQPEESAKARGNPFACRTFADRTIHAE
jgi:hypothetical protein